MGASSDQRTNGHDGRQPTNNPITQTSNLKPQTYLFTITGYPPAIGGAQGLAHRLAVELAALGHRLTVASHWNSDRHDWLLGTTLAAPPIAPYALDGIAVQPLPPHRLASLIPTLAYYPLLRLGNDWPIRRLSTIIQRELARIVTPTPTLPLEGGGGKEAPLEGGGGKEAPLEGGGGIELIHNIRMGREAISYASLGLARRLDVPFALTPLHHPRWTVGWRHAPFRRLYQEADLLFALTDAEAHTLTDLGVKSERIVVTGVGPTLAATYDAAAFRARYRLGDAPFVLFIGQKYAYKGYAALLAASRLVRQHWPDCRFVFIGPRTPASRRAFAPYTEADGVIELGAISDADKTAALAACTMLCVPSSQESFGAVYVEAWALGKPVIAADIPATRSLIAHGAEGDGLLSPPDPASLAERITYLLAHPSVAAAMGQRGRQKLAVRYTWPRLAAIVEAAFARLL